MQDINAFFDEYAKALERLNTKLMAQLYNIPCTMLSDDATTIFNDAGKLEGFFNQGVGFYRQFGIVGVRPDVWNRKPWSKKIVQVKVNWQYFDLQKKPIYNCDYHYVLKLDKHNQWKIILSVSENERERMEEWQRSIQK